MSQESPVNDNLSLLLAVESARRFPSFESNSLLSNLLELIPANYELYPPLGQMTGSSVAFSLDGRFVVCAQSRALKLIDIATHGELWRLKIDDEIRAVRASPDNRLVWLITNHGIRALEIATGRQVRQFVFKVDTPLDLSADLSRVLTVSRQDLNWTARVSDTSTGRQINQLSGKHGLGRAALSRDGRWLFVEIASKAKGEIDYSLRMLQCFKRQAGLAEKRRSGLGYLFQPRFQSCQHCRV